MTGATPEQASPSPNFRISPTGGRLATTYDLKCNRPNTRRVFREIGFRTWRPPAPKSRPYHWDTAACFRFDSSVLSSSGFIASAVAFCA
ncbi:hypothetical protein AVEN_136845-1 [Araneus ventricosus]|uniref:Uncharacterized protein n=1 Tax=Araneus ventricosus TaxID=182803 RepID=A0A4Y2G1L5_ARAVE|nr:hypothetical protein AVEN_136845-1 [Araneus ventricosus]